MLAQLHRTSSTLRSCYRCGQEFRSENKDLICSTCRAPKRRSKVRNRNLSFREDQIVALVCQAKQNKEIAYELHLSEGTIKEYLNRIFRKVDVKSRTELAIWALTGREKPAGAASHSS